MIDIIKIAVFIVVFVLSFDIFRLIGNKVIYNLDSKKLKFVFCLFIGIFILSVSISLYFLLKHQTLEEKSFLIGLVSYMSLKSLKNKLAAK